MRKGSARTGRLIFGAPEDLPSKVLENGVWYALELTHHRDASFYLDTRNLRAWAKAHLRGQRVLNTFAYTGSLGVAARAAPSGQVITTDVNQAVLAIAAASFALNGFTASPREFCAGDFFAGHQNSDDERVYHLDDRVTLRGIDALNRNRSLASRVGTNLRRLVRLRAALKAFKPDAIVAFTTEANLVAIWSALGLGVPVVVSERNQPDRPGLGRLTRTVRRLSYPLAAALVVLRSG